MVSHSTDLKGELKFFYFFRTSFNLVSADENLFSLKIDLNLHIYCFTCSSTDFFFSLSFFFCKFLNILMLSMGSSMTLVRTVSSRSESLLRESYSDWIMLLFDSDWLSFRFIYLLLFFVCTLWFSLELEPADLVDDALAIFSLRSLLWATSTIIFPLDLPGTLSISSDPDVFCYSASSS